VAGTAVYLTSRLDVVPVPSRHNLKHNKTLHQRIVLLRIVTEHIPRVRPENRIEVVHLAEPDMRISRHTALRLVVLQQFPLRGRPLRLHAATERSARAGEL
jgi:K+ transporter